MSSTARGLSSYRTTQVQSRTPLELVVMLYDGALKFMAAARDAIDRRDIPARRDALSRTLAIISELQSTLNLTEGGQVAAELDRLYSYANSRLLEAAMKNDVAAIDDVKRVFEILRDGWNIIATQPVGALNAIAMQPMAARA
jgi:flagellar protein FliS